MNVFPTPRGHVIALTYGPDADWVKNVQAAGGCDLQTRGRHLRLTAPRLVHDERRRDVPIVVRRLLRLAGVADFLVLQPAHGPDPVT
ncbi:hypothetical protein [Pseudonocardia sp. H11422]|uniref:hypothetical protein n=1 Tax=Pseudonocardia sp. H11422 TaxID=2835866 RepID=UPI0027E33DCD|nr:hypothetical protein [Pseudonocardia sp. H11422]